MYLLLLSVLLHNAAAYNLGITGYSQNGCTCHGASASAQTSAAFSTASTTVAPGDTLLVSLAVSSTSATC